MVGHASSVAATGRRPTLRLADIKGCNQPMSELALYPRYAGYGLIEALTDSPAVLGNRLPSYGPKSPGFTT